MSRSRSQFRQFVHQTATEIGVDFVLSFDKACREWLDDPNLTDEKIIECQNSQHWMLMIGQYFGKLIGIARKGVGGQLVAARGKVKIWKAWLEKLNAMVSDDQFGTTKKQIERIRIMNRYNHSKIGAYLGPDDIGTVRVYTDQLKKRDSARSRVTES